jgi:eukaryotic-like serine/threonine-protein kinase
MKHDADDLRLLSSLLDQCTDLSEPQREAWLAGLTGEAARLRSALRTMLAREAAGDLDHFLESPPVFAVPDTDIASSDFKADDCVGPYRLLRLVGRGGMGEVWLATRSDGQLKRSVALKLPILSVRRSVLAQRFERERDILGALIHPHIARLYDAGVAEDGQPYMALEYVEGTPITQAADDRALDARGRVRLLRQVMDAVQYAHANLVIHRDLKPGNVLATAEGETKLLDFGIAKLVEAEAGASADSELTRLGGRSLTLRYAAPELISGGAASTAVDIWALGVLLYELLTGLRPFGGDGNGPVEHDILTRDPTRPSQRRSGAIARLSRSLAGDLDTIAFKALKKDPSQRYTTVGAFAEDLDRWLHGEPVRAQRDSAWYRIRRFVGRHKLAVAAAACAGIAVIGAASTAVVLGLQAREESARAVAARDFMVDIFRRADPDLSQGKEVSAKQLLGQGYTTVLETMQAQPLLQSELLIGIGKALESMDDLPGTDAAYAEAAARYRRMGMLRAAAALTVDRAALRLGAHWEVPIAIGLLAQAEAQYPGHAADEEFLARHATYRTFAADLAGDKTARQTWYELARSHADRTFHDASSRTMLAVRFLAITEGNLRYPQRAVARLGALLDRLQAEKSAVPADALSVLIDLGSMERRMGRYPSALDRFNAASSLCQKSLNPKGTQCVYNQFHRSNLLLLLGYDELAMDTVPFLIAPGAAVETSWAMRRAVQAFEVLAKNHRLDEHPDVVSTVIAVGDLPADQRENWQAQHVALEARVRNSLREGQAQMAMKLSAQSRSLISARGVDDDRFTLKAHVLEAMSFDAWGDHETALKMLDRACADQVKALGAEDPVTQLVSINRVRPLWALQRHQEALALIDHAVPVLREAMGAQAPTLVRLEGLRAELATAGSGTPQDLRKTELFL